MNDKFALGVVIKLWKYILLFVVHSILQEDYKKTTEEQFIAKFRHELNR